MEKEYSVRGMTCNGCIAKVKEAVEGINEVEKVSVQLDYPQMVITYSTPVDMEEANILLSKVGNYSISHEKIEPVQVPFPEIKKRNEEVIPAEKSIDTYRPLILTVAFIVGVSVFVQYPFEAFSGVLWMRHFMAGFFIVFSFFKLLNISGFASSYAMYDIIAAKWKGWGYIYPFMELGLGVAYLINFAPFYTNLTTVIVLGVSSIGVIQSNLNKRKIKCACLGDVFNLPMSTVTIVEDLTMVAMAGLMLVR